MAFDSRVYRILIASPSDVAEEREIVVRVIQEWNDLYSHSRKIVLLPLRWETHTAPEYNVRPQEVINRAIVDECDLLVGVFWTRIGSPTGVAESGTLEEIERVGGVEKPVMLYFSRVAIDPDLIDFTQNERLKEFKSNTYPKGLVESYKSLIEFRDKFAKQLELRVRELQKADSVDKSPLEIDFYCTEKDDFVGQEISKSTENPTIKDWKEVPKDKIEDIKDAVSEKTKSIVSLPLPLVLRNLSSSGIRNVYVEMKLSSTSDSVEISEGRFDDSSHEVYFFNRLNKIKKTAIGKNSKVAIFDTDSLQKTDKGWTLSAEWEAIQPQRIRLLKPLLYIYAPENTTISISVKILADSFPQPYEATLKMNVSVNNREVKLENILPEWKELLEDDIPF